MQNSITTYSFIPKEKFISKFYTTENLKVILSKNNSIFTNEVLNFILKTIKKDLPPYIPLNEDVIRSLKSAISSEYEIIKLYIDDATNLSNWCLIYILDWKLSEWGSDTGNSIFPTYNKLINHRVILEYS